MKRIIELVRNIFGAYIRAVNEPKTEEEEAEEQALSM
jgi:hypothetical protein